MKMATFKKFSCRPRCFAKKERLAENGNLTAREHHRFIEDLGDDILRSVLDFIYVHPIVLWGTMSAFAG